MPRSTVFASWPRTLSSKTRALVFPFAADFAQIGGFDAMLATPEETASMAGTSLPSHQPRKVLACETCQRRKVKCDRSFPCGNCVKADLQCHAAPLQPRQRRKRFPERELLERLRRYEGLLRDHGVTFEPLHGDAATALPPLAGKNSSSLNLEASSPHNKRKGPSNQSMYVFLALALVPT